MNRILTKRAFAALLSALVVTCGVSPAWAQMLSPAQQSIMSARTMTSPTANPEKQPVLTTPQNEPDSETVGAVDHALSSLRATGGSNDQPPLAPQDIFRQAEACVVTDSADKAVNDRGDRRRPACSVGACRRRSGGRMDIRCKDGGGSSAAARDTAPL